MQANANLWTGSIITLHSRALIRLDRSKQDVRQSEIGWDCPDLGTGTGGQHPNQARSTRNVQRVRGDD